MIISKIMEIFKQASYYWKTYKIDNSVQTILDEASIINNQITAQHFQQLVSLYRA